MHPADLLRRSASPEKFGQPVFVFNPNSTRAESFIKYFRELSHMHPHFHNPHLVKTSANFADTVKTIAELGEDGECTFITAGGDGTANAVAHAIHGTQHVMCYMPAGNKSNVAANLPRSEQGIMLPHELIDEGKIHDIYPLELTIGGEKRLALTVANIGMLSAGAQYLNGDLRKVPGYKNERVRKLVHEKMLLVARSALADTFELTESDNHGNSRTGRLLDYTVANARIIGEYALFPRVDLLSKGAYITTVSSHSGIPHYARTIQDGTSRGEPLEADDVRHITVHKDTLASVDGEVFRLNAGQTMDIRVSDVPIRVLAGRADGSFAAAA